VDRGIVFLDHRRVLLRDEFDVAHRPAHVLDAGRLFADPRDQDDQRKDEQKNFRDNAAAKAVATERIFLAKPALAPTKLDIALLIVHRAIDLFRM
jgi:hypothetical protein